MAWNTTLTTAQGGNVLGNLTPDQVATIRQFLTPLESRFPGLIAQIPWTQLGTGTAGPGAQGPSLPMPGYQGGMPTGLQSAAGGALPSTQENLQVSDATGGAEGAALRGMMMNIFPNAYPDAPGNAGWNTPMPTQADKDAYAARVAAAQAAGKYASPQQASLAQLNAFGGPR